MDAANKKGDVLCPPRGRPPCGLLGTFEPWVKDQIDKWRPDNKGWGPITIHHELIRVRTIEEHLIPCIKSIADYLRAQGRTRPYRRENALPDSKLMIGKYAHDVWQMDAEGNKTVASIGRMTFINVKDTYSKVYAQSLPVPCLRSQSHATVADYQLALRLAWSEFGMNRCLQVDHESIYYDNTHLSPFPTKMHLWLKGMGLKMILTPKGKPYRQGAAERCHQTLDRQICHHHGCVDYGDFLLRCQVRRKAVNEYLPCRMLNNKAPLQVYSEAKHSGRTYRIEIEEELFDEQLVINYLGSCTGWQRKIDANQCLQLGGQRYYLSKSVIGQEVEITVDKSTRLIIFSIPHSQQTQWRLPIKGCTFESLAGSITQHINWVKEHQVALNFNG